MDVVYGRNQVARNMTAFSPSAFKPKRLAEYLHRCGLSVTLHDPVKLSRKQLALAHDPEYVDGVLDLKIDNGFRNTDSEVAASLPYTSGSLYRACELALTNSVKMAASFTSGFHHARYNDGGGFCTFNGLVVAAQLLKQAGKIKTVLILDCDEHYGDGTDQIIKHLELDYIRHATFGGCNFAPRTSGLQNVRLLEKAIRKNFQAHTANPIKTKGDYYLEELKRIMTLLQVHPVDLVIYQAGADVHVNDPLGGTLTTEEMAQRDRMVFQACHQLQIPLAWNLAGGYNVREEFEHGSIEHLLPVLDLHKQTYEIGEEIYYGH